MLSQIVSANEHLKGVANAKINSRLVYIIHILRENGRIGQLSANDVKPVSDFVLNLPVSRFQSIARSRRAFNYGCRR
jgi:hypothetical protein